MIRIFKNRKKIIYFFQGQWRIKLHLEGILPSSKGIHQAKCSKSASLSGLSVMILQILLPFTFILLLQNLLFTHLQLIQNSNNMAVQEYFHFVVHFFLSVTLYGMSS